MISFIIVNYRVEKLLVNCLKSIYKHIANIPFEIIVVENNPSSDLSIRLSKFKNLTYVKAWDNLGFAKGNNLGAKHARGEYLFFLNPDTEIISGDIKKLISNFKDKNVGIAAPLLVDAKNKPFELQGSGRLTPLAAIFSLSFIYKVWPNNKIAYDFWLKHWDKKKKIETETVPGTAILIKKKLLKKIGGFDENIFLFFEENDICNRVIDLGYKLVIDPSAKVFHYWGASTKKEKKIGRIFLKSRFYYFKKHYGVLSSILVNLFLELKPKFLLLFSVLALGLFLRFDKLNELMMFIGDQGWFYISARDMILTGNIPLVGITSSLTWLHQGALWTYMLALAFLVSNFNPASGAILTAFIGLLSIYLIYKIGEEFFTKEIGILVALLFATSPLIIVHARMAYHTSPIPFFVLLLIYSVLKVISGNYKFLLLVPLSFSLLYNLHLGTVIFIPVVLFLFILAFIRKEKWVMKLAKEKFIIASSIILGAIPMVPILIYDFNNGFPQTIKFAAWFVYKGLQMIGVIERTAGEPFTSVVQFFINKMSWLIFAPSAFISVAILIFALGFCAVSIKKRFNLFSPLVLIFSLTSIGLAGFFAAGARSEAYLPMLFPGIILLTAFSFYSVFKNKAPAILIIFAISVFNAVFIIQNNYLIERIPGYGPSLNSRIEVVEAIINQARGREYNIEGRGVGSEFKSFTMNYEYLLWWKGHAPSREKEDLVFSIEEKQGKINVTIK
jgi:GT2 family glycosyltransferase